VWYVGWVALSVGLIGTSFADRGESRGFSLCLRFLCSLYSEIFVSVATICEIITILYS